MPLPSTLTPIATNTLTTATASISFSNIPQTYTDLVLVVRGGTTASAASKVNLNNVTSGIYANTRFWGDGTSTASDRAPNSGEMYTGGGWFSDGMFVVNILNYTNTNIYKPMLSRYSNPSSFTFFNCTTWMSTNAVTSIQVGLNTSTYISGTSFTLYGVKAA